MSNLSVAECTLKYSIATISSGEKLPTATLARKWNRKKRLTPPIKNRWPYKLTINVHGPGNFY